MKKGKQIRREIELSEEQTSRQKRNNYIYLVLFVIYQPLMIILNGVFVRPQPTSSLSGIDNSLFTAVGVFLLVLIGTNWDMQGSVYIFRI